MNVPEEIYQRAIQAGFTKEAACALLAMIQGESAFLSDNAEDRIHAYGISDEEYLRRAEAGLVTINGRNFIYDEVGFGYAQWTFWSRKRFLYEYCVEKGKSLADHETQKEFIFVEMERDFPGIWKLCHESHDLSEITKLLINIWENPADHDKAYKVRFPYAQAWLAKSSNWKVEDDISEKDTAERTWPPRTIQKGLNWPETYLLQSALNCHNFSVVINGIFDERTENKVKDYQVANKLTADGIVGPMTWRSLLTLPENY